MAEIPLYFNSETAGGNIRAIIQKLPSTVPKQIWSDTLGDWTTAAATPVLADRTYPVTEQVPGESFIAYEGLANFVSSYTGNIGIGYIDAAAAPLKTPFSEIRYFINGAEVTFTIAQNHSNIRVADPFVMKMSRRADGSVVANNDVSISDAFADWIAFEADVLTPDGVYIADINNIVVSPAGALAVTSSAPAGTRVNLLVDGNQVAGNTYDITLDILMNIGGVKQLNGKVICKATP